MATELLYWKDAYQCEGSGSLREVGRDERGVFALLDRTIFYPQGGGQPTDHGTIVVSGVSIAVKHAGLVDGEVRHYGEFPETLSLPQSVIMKVDASRRQTHAKSHTAGHLLAGLVESLLPTLRGTKAYHFPEGPYVEFEGEAATDNLLPTLNERLKAAIAQAPVVSAETQAVHRTVSIAGFSAVPCGGTHLRSLSELTAVTATKLKRKDGKVRISYTCS